MSVPTDLSLMDFLFEREDPILNLTEKDTINRNDQKDVSMAAESWPTNPDEFLDSFLKFENHPFEILDESELLSAACTIATDVPPPASSCSDSGVSSDQQLSPLLQEVEEDDRTFSSGSENSPMEASQIYSDQEGSFQEDVEIDSSVFNLLDTNSLGEVKVEDNQAIISMNVLSTPQQAEHVATTTVTTPVRQVIRVTPVSGNPRSILLPVSLKDVKDIKTIKIINATSPRKQQAVTGVRLATGSRATLQTKPVLVKSAILQDDVSIASSKGSLSEETGDESDSQYPRLQLTSEEKRLLQKEGVRLPSHYPLTKHEERELKRIRRKIRNKISAQDSRKRKKEYIDGLEERVKQCTEENLHLVKRIKALQTQNQTLATQLRKLQSVLARGTAKTAQPATCLMVLLLSMALVMAPNLRLNQNSPSNTEGQKDQDLSQSESKMAPLGGRSRNLLEFPKSAVGDEGSIGSGEQDISKEDEAKFISDMAELLKMHNPVVGDHDYGAPPLKRTRKDDILEDIKPSQLPGGKDYIVPPDEVWPPSAAGDNVIGNTIEKALGEEVKVNITDAGGTRTVVLQVPKEQ
ncbi:cyclic AMP-responsive element-binding protein 3-like protein 1 [Periplaneta americana]|uniref:cyclic AMP-responsive element-binding protein 3-like protein 1 n=1 Tax=Periplaneta americana TaxID=6978 RepID=UPI0037E94DEC